MYALNSLTGYDYLSAFSDPRLISAAHSGQRLTLDAPVRNGTVAMATVYDDRPGYNTNYDDFHQIRGGDILYYYDSSIGVPFIKPLFEEGRFLKTNYIDPMGTIKPHFERPAADNVCGKGGGLTWLRDSQYQRADIMSRQIWNRNQTEPMYLFP